MLNQIAGTHDAAEPAMHDAGFNPVAIQRLINTIKI
jgi:ATP-dependent Clp protease protease subunit